MQASDPDPTQDAEGHKIDTGVSLDRNGSTAVLTTHGEFDALTTPQLQTAIQQTFEKAPEALVVDLTRVTFFGSAAIAALVEARQLAGEQTALRLAVAPYLDRTLKLIGLEGVFELFTSVEEALAADDG
ncbi:STAS domain-containing protein [Amycolatopsis sp. FDAARGOS 1241]|uniref:STAS domain-containing protein n=1 Tax=Amycolatopsis sp. FDAARGOS 1241 TaxID=2778070 RepID=UPI0019512D57|nr:STAS domain-containing protein [Amycolatopsis sp. FDAARGOS 1241]QRP48434.1 STAS domain-containing protein [Amycolatopsis sp. FDAARGOS 1241]